MPSPLVKKITAVVVVKIVEVGLYLKLVIIMNELLFQYCVLKGSATSSGKSRRKKRDDDQGTHTNFGIIMVMIKLS